MSVRLGLGGTDAGPLSVSSDVGLDATAAGCMDSAAS